MRKKKNLAIINDDPWLEPYSDAINGRHQDAVNKINELTGGTGKAKSASPVQLAVQDGQITATFVWSSANYDYMKVDGVRYDAVIEDGHSVFTVPVASLEEPLPVVADTVAMSAPHEIEYTITFDAASLAASGK